MLCAVDAGSGTGARLRRTYFDSFPAQRTLAQRLMWNGYVEHAPGGYLRLTQKGRIAAKGLARAS